MSSVANSNDRRQRLREQMRQFYGDPDAAVGGAARRSQEGAAASRRAAGVAPEMDPDSEYFNVGKYTTELLRRESLKGLVESDTELLRSVRRLDGDLQELVYRNYAKFISATDTIREMRDNVALMDTKLQALSTNVASIDDAAKTVSDRLHEYNGVIENTITTNRMLKKIQFLVALPATMRSLLEKKAYGVCVKYWVAGDGFLSKHAAAIPSVENIQTECRALAKELYDRIKTAMCAVSLDDPEAMEGIRGYVENLRLLRATTLFPPAGAEHSQPQDDGLSFDESVLKVLMHSASDNFAKGAAAAQRGVRLSLAVPDDLSSQPLAARAEALSRVGLREALAQLKSSCAMLAVNSERVYSLLNRLDGSKVAIRVAQEVQPVLVDLLPALGGPLGELAVAVLSSIADEGMTTLRAPETVRDALAAAVAAFARQLKHVAVTLKTLGGNYLDTAHSRQSHSYAAMVDEAVCGAIRAVAAALAEKAWQQPTEAAVRATVGSYTEAAAHQHHRHGAMAVAAAGEGGGGGGGAQLPEWRCAFAVSRWTYAAAAALLISECATHLAQGDILPADRTAASAAQLTDAAHLLLHRGVVLVGQLEVAAVAAPALGSAGDAVDPTLPAARGGGVSAALASLVQRDWAQLHAVLEALPLATLKPLETARGGSLGRPGHPAGAGNASYGSRLFTGSAGRSSGPRSTVTPSAGRGGSGRPTVSYNRRADAALQSNVAAVFAGASATLLHTAPASGGTAAVMAGVVLYLLKGLVAFVRGEGVRGYGQAAFHRVQVHATYLLRALVSPARGTAPRQWAKAWGGATQAAIQELADEICCCAYDCYEAKVPLSHAALEKILEEATAAAAAAAEGPGGAPQHGSEPTDGGHAAAPPAPTPPETQTSPSPSAGDAARQSQRPAVDVSRNDTFSRKFNDEEELPT